MGKAFFSAEDKRQKLHQSICMYKGKPCYVQCSPDHKVNTVTITTLAGRGVGKNIEYTDDEFNYKDIRLGYINYGLEAIYLVRQPIRQYKQGLCHEVIKTVPEGIAYVPDMVRSKSMENCILGEHPEYSKALKDVVDGEATSRAFSRHCAVGTDKNFIYLYYRGRRVGQMRYDSDEFVLLPTGEHSFIRDIMSREGVKVC